MITRRDADALAVDLLGGRRTELGDLQIEHARRVADGLPGEDEDVLAAALLHDVLEKTTTSAQQLATATADSAVVRLVELLTRLPHESDLDYLSRVAADPTATRVKRVDLADKLTGDDRDPPAGVVQIRDRAAARLRLLDVLVAEQAKRGDSPRGPTEEAP